MKQSGAIAVSLKDVRNSIGKDRQEWRLALEAELQSLQDTGAIEAVTHAPRGKQVLPMKAVLTLKPIEGVKTKRKKARVCICGNFQTKKDGESYYTANVNITSIRFVLSEAVQRNYGASSLDIDTAFLNVFCHRQQRN